MSTYTPNINLEKPDRGGTWWEEFNSDLDLVDTHIGSLNGSIDDLPEVERHTGTFNSTTGDTITLTKTVDAINEYGVKITPTSRAGAIGDIWVTKTTTNFVVKCAEANTTDTFEAIVFHTGDMTSYGGSVYRRYYVSPSTSITDHSVVATVGSFAYILNQMSGTSGIIEFPANRTYTITANSVSVPAGIKILLQSGAGISIASGKTLTINSPNDILAQADQNIFSGDGTVIFSDPGTVYPEWWGAVFDGVTDDGPEIRAALTAAVAHSKIIFSNGVYAVTGTTGIPLTKSVDWEMSEGSKLLFSDDATVYVYALNVTGLTFNNLTIDAGSPSVRGNWGALHLVGCSNTRTNGLRVLSCAGPGYFVSGGSNHNVSGSNVEDTLADGFHWTGAVVNFSGTNLIAENTGDDSFSVVSYLADGSECTDGNLVGLVSRNSDANAFKIAGGKRIKGDVVGYNTGAHGMTICEDSFYSTYVTEDCQVKAVIDTTTLLGVNMVEDCNDIDLNVIIKNAGTDGVYIGSATTTAKNIVLNGEVSGAGSSGVEIHTASNITIGNISVLENVGYGFAIVDSTNVSIGTIFAYNNNTGADGVKDNVYLDGLTNGCIGTIEAVDDRTPKLVHRAVETLGLTDVVIGAVHFSGSIDTTYPIYIYQPTTSNFKILTPIEIFLTFGPADTTPSVMGYDNFKTSNGVATTITTFDDGYIGKKIIVIIGDPNTTLDFTGSSMYGNGGVDWSAGQGDWLEAVYDGTYWYCAVHEI